MNRNARMERLIRVEHADASLAIRARAFNILVLGFWHLFIIVILVLLIHRIIEPYSVYGASTVLAVTFVSLTLCLAYLFSFKGHFKAGVWTFIAAMLGGISIAHFARGEGNAIIMVYPIIVITAGLLLSLRSAVLCTAISIFTYMFTNFLVSNYGTYLEEDHSTLMVNNNLAVMASLAVVLIITWLFTRNIHEYIRELEAKNREKEVLLREIHHRVKNNLQIVSSLLSLQSQSVEDPEARAAFRESIGRVKSMALVHERIYISEDLSSIPIKSYMENLLEHIGRTHGAESGITIIADIEDAELDIEPAINLGLILNELVSNCFKHAFGNLNDGCEKKVTVKFRKGIDRAEMAVTDNGKGMATGSRPGTLGLQLVETLVNESSGRMTIDGSDGTEVRISLDLKGGSIAQG